MNEFEIEKLSEILGLGYEKVGEGIESGTLKKEETHYRIEKRWAGYPKGTVIFGNDELILGFPKIRRAMVLDPTIKRHFEDTSSIAIEEKMNGYNVRVVSIDGDIWAFTRGGLSCPYTTHRAKEELDLSFFDKYPNLVLCGEMVGPDNPYVPKTIYNVGSIEFFIFDIMEKKTGDKLSVEERREIVDSFDLTGTPLINICDPVNGQDAAKKIIRKLNNENREGVVIKDVRSDVEPIKYTTSSSNRSDLRFAYRYFYDYGSDFLHSRTVREAFQSEEWEEDTEELEERAKKLGMSILEPMRKTIKDKKEERVIAEKVSIKISDIKVAEKFRSHLKGQGIEFEFTGFNELEDGCYRFEIDKIYRPTNDKTNSILGGGLW